MFQIFNLKNISLRRSVFLLMLAIGFIGLYVKSVDPNMTVFNHRAIGNASINGIDARIYTSSFWKCAIIFFAVFLIGNFVIEKISEFISRFRADYDFEFEYDLIFEFSFLLLINEINLFYDVFASHQIKAVPIFLAFVTAIVFLHAGLNILFPIKNKLQNTLPFLIPIPLTYLAVLLKFWNSEGIMIMSIFGGAVYVVFYLITRLLIRNTSLKIAFSRALMPLSFLPLTFIFGNELQYTLTKYNINSDPKLITLILSISLIILSLLLMITKKDNDENKIIHKIEVFVIPVLIVTAGIFWAHKQIIEPSFDYLHGGNSLVPAQQLYQFGILPLADYWAPQHWPIGAYIYALLNGYNFSEITIWNGIIDNVIAILICYFLLRKFTSSRWAALLLCFTPMLSYLQSYYSIGLIPLFYYDILRENRRIRDYAIMMLIALVAFVFMASAGKIAVLGAFFLMILSFTNIKDFKNALTGILSVLLPLGAIYFALVLMRGESIIDRIRLIEAMSNCDVAIGAYWAFINPATTPFEMFTAFGVFPFAAFLSLMFAFRVKEKTEKHYALIFLAFAVIIAYLRIFGRHSLTEGNQALFFPFLLFVIPFVFIKKKSFKSCLLSYHNISNLYSLCKFYTRHC